MRETRKFVSILLVFSLMFTMSLGFAFAESEIGDTAAPVVNSMQILNPEIGDGSAVPLNVQFDWVEEGIGINVIHGAVKNIDTNEYYGYCF